MIQKVTRTIGILVLIPQLVFAWGDLGHQTIAEIAQRSLSPKGKKLVNEVLGVGPLAAAATWPDLVRSDSRFSEFSVYHYLEIDPRFLGRYQNIPNEQRVSRDANAMIEGVPKELFKKSGLFFKEFDRSQRMNLLRFFVHIVGDVHQPFHVGNGYDRGANLCEIRYSDPEKKMSSLMSMNQGLKSTNLHAFWDDDLVKLMPVAQKKKDPLYKAEGYFGYAALATLVLTDKDIVALKERYEEFARKPTLDWYKESQDLHPKVYPDASPYTHPLQRPYCRHIVKDANGHPIKDGKTGRDLVEPDKLNPEVVPVIQEEYMSQAAEIIKLQLLKGGLRLAFILNTLAENHYFNDVNEAKEKDDLKKILLENKISKKL